MLTGIITAAALRGNVTRRQKALQPFAFLNSADDVSSHAPSENTQLLSNISLLTVENTLADMLILLSAAHLGFGLAEGNVHSCAVQLAT